MPDVAFAGAIASVGSLLTLLCWVAWLLARLVRAIEAVGCDCHGKPPAMPPTSLTDTAKPEPEMIGPAHPASKAALWQRVAFPS